MFEKLFRLLKVIKGKDFYSSLQIKCNTVTLGDKSAEWMICPDNINANSIIYSFGIGENISYDLELIKRYNVTVHAFDPTPKSLEWLKKQELPEQFKSYPFGLADYDGDAEFHLPENAEYVSCSMIDEGKMKNQFVKVNVCRLKTLMGKLNHTEIDILKMDIEGAEYSVLNDILKEKLNIKQILIEFHHRYKNVGIEKSISAIKLLNSHGYKIFAVSFSGEEYSFIKINQ